MIPTAVSIAFEIMLTVGLVCCLARAARGPSAADRMVAIDLLGLLAAVFMLSLAIRHQDESIIDVVLVFALIAFFGTVALARYLQIEAEEPEEPAAERPSRTPKS